MSKSEGKVFLRGFKCSSRYYISPPHSFGEVWDDPIHALSYVTWQSLAKYASCITLHESTSPSSSKFIEVSYFSWTQSFEVFVCLCYHWPDLRWFSSWSHAHCFRRPHAGEHGSDCRSDCRSDPFRVPVPGCARCISPEAWIDVSGSSARDVARQLREQQLMMPGYRDSDLPKASREQLQQLQISFRKCLEILFFLIEFRC